MSDDWECPVCDSVQGLYDECECGLEPPSPTSQEDDPNDR